MSKAHCPKCAGYEDRVMRKGPDETLPAEVVPCAAFEMSDRFRKYVSDNMRSHVQEQVKAAGLDRMAVVKAPPAK